MKKIGKFFLGLLIFISSFTWEIIQCALGLICTIYCILASMGKKVLEFRWYKGEILVFGEFNSTGVSLVTVEHSGQNRICMTPGANLDYFIEDLDKLEDLIKVYNPTK